MKIGRGVICGVTFRTPRLLFLSEDIKQAQISAPLAHLTGNLEDLRL